MHINKFREIRIRNINYIIMACACILYTLLIIETVNMAKKYLTLADSTESYIDCEEDTMLLNEASDYLTEQSRLYVINGETLYAEAYFVEINQTRRRDQALENLEDYHVDDAVYQALQNALEKSNELTKKEIYAMKLAAVANNCDMSTLPQEIRETKLSGKHKKMTGEEQLELARKMVFDDDYQQTKKEIQNYVSQATEPLLIKTRTEYRQNGETLKSAINHERIYVSLLLLCHIVTSVALIYLVIRPLHNCINSIKKNELMKVKGSYEVKYLALTYNEIYLRNVTNEKILRKKAEKDALTGIKNRGAFDEFLLKLKNTDLPIAFLLIDVDHFKQINDNYGHITGDSVLKNVAKKLTGSFRHSDIIGRFGGDEFAVIMSNITEEKRDVIAKKVERLNHVLSNPKDGMPPVSLSIGVAFSTEGYSDKLLKQADSALYQVKEHGRCGCAFYRKQKKVKEDV